MSDDAAFDEVVAGVYRAAAARCSWTLALDGIAALLKLWGAQVIGVDRRNGGLLFSHEGGPAPPQATLDYLRTYHRVNPRLGPMLAAPPGAWLHDHELFDGRFIASSPFHQEFLVPYGGLHCSAIKIEADPQTLVIFAAMRGVGSPHIAGPDLDLLNRLHHHLVEAMSIHQSVRSLQMESMAGRSVLDRFRQPVILIDQQRILRFRNQAATDLLEEGDVATEGSGFLRLRDPRHDRQMLVHLRELDLGGHAAGDAGTLERAVMRLRKSSDDAPVALLLLPLRPGSMMGAFGDEGLALGMFIDPAFRRDPDPAVIAAAFGLTPAEARVAGALTTGKAPEELADDVGVAISTIRTQIRSLLEKTGARRQAEMVSILAAFPSM